MSYRAIIYASPTGSGVGSKADPASISQAQTIARASGPNTLVLLRGGTYRLAAPLAFTAADNFITWQAYPGEVPVLSGGVDITTGWALDAGSVYRRAWAGNSRQLWVADARATRSRSVAQVGWTVAGVNPVTAPDATIAGFARPQDVELVCVSQWQFYRVHVASAVGTAVTIKASEWADSQTRPTADWRQMDTVNWYENSRELVTTAGYWYLNLTSGTLYYYPLAGQVPNVTEVIGGNLEVLVTVTGTLDMPVVGLAFRGITFSHATWLDPNTNGYSSILTGYLVRNASLAHMVRVPGAVRLFSAQGCVIAGCSFSHLGAAGVTLDYGSRGCVIENNTFADVSAANIVIGDVTHLLEDPFPTDVRQRLSSNVVRNNVTTGSGLEYGDAAGICLGYTDNTTIINNELSGLSYSGVTSGFGHGCNDPAFMGNGGTGFPPGVGPVPPSPTCNTSLTVSNNRIGTWGQTCGDSGSIYLDGAHPSTNVAGNYANASGGGHVPKVNFYLDAGTTGVLVSGNVADQVVTDATFTQSASVPNEVVVAHGNIITGNFANAVGDSISAFNTVITPTAVGAFGPTAAAIVANAGRE